MFALYNDLISVCKKIETHWLKVNNASEHFYNVVWEHTEKIDLTPFGEVANQMRLLDHPMVRVNQQRSTFSDLYFQIFNNGRFMIEILNWAGSHVNVHDHDFSGVQFQLKGDSLNVVYDFDGMDEVHGALRFGDLKIRKAELWKQGGRSIVRSGTVDPHCVFHLANPTTSLLIRTLPTTRLGSQSNYFPSLAAHYAVNTDLQRKKLSGLNLLDKESKSEFRTCFRQFLDSQSLAENFFMMLKLGQRLFTQPYVDLISEYAGRGGPEAKIVANVAVNNGIDFFKRKTNLADSRQERLALFSIAASTRRGNLAQLVGDLASSGVDLHLDVELHKFLSKQQGQDLSLAKNYLKLFEVNMGINDQTANI